MHATVMPSSAGCSSLGAAWLKHYIIISGYRSAAECSYKHKVECDIVYVIMLIKVLHNKMNLSLRGYMSIVPDKNLTSFILGEGMSSGFCPSIQ